MNIDTPMVVVEGVDALLVKDVNGNLWCECADGAKANKLAAIINLHGELVEHVEALRDVTNTGSYWHHKAVELLARCTKSKEWLESKNE